MRSLIERANACVHCGLCTRQCAFLEKYGLDLNQFSKRSDLAYHCFLCGNCSAVCPKEIDGREIALSMRRQRVSDAGGRRVPEQGYGALIAEKKNYLFQNFRNSRRSVLFPGCNFPSFYPKTTDALIRLLREEADMGVVFDCCGKPIAELGLEHAEAQGTELLRRRLCHAGVEELVVLCPSCFYFLRPRLDIPVVSIYDKLRELGLGGQIKEREVNLFVPCPDKATHEMERSLFPFLTGAYREIPEVQCCGLGGCAAGKEPELSAGFQENVKHMKLPNVYVYCASCAGSLCRGGVTNVRHVLTDILGTNESPVLSAQTVWNRAKRML